jgi:signal transduction histidine kinase
MDPNAARDADRVAVSLLPDQSEVRLGERALAVARVLLAIAALFVSYILPPPRIAYVEGLLLFYSGFAAILLMALLGPNQLPSRLPWLVQAADVTFVAILALFPIGDTVPFFSFLLFPLFTAASRWGFREVMITTIIIETVIVSDALARPRTIPSAILVRVVAMAASGAAIGYLAEQQRRRRFEDRALAVILGRTRLGGSLSGTINLVLASVRNAFRAQRVLVVFREQSTGRVVLWRADAADADALAAGPSNVPASHQDDYWFDAAGIAWHAWRGVASRSRRFRAVALDTEGRPLGRRRIDVPQGFLADHRCRRLIGATVPLSEDWRCRLFVLDPALGVHREQTARFALELVKSVGPALYDNYLIRSIRSRARSLERARIGREMHDGVTQSLLGLEMEIAVLRRRAKVEAPGLVDDLARVHGIVRDEVVTVRELMEGIRVDDIGAGDVAQHLSGVVDRFTRSTGIAARFVSDGKPAALTPNARRQVARIVHEALVNIRKHSGADRAVVHANVAGSWWKISIEDDGRGFPFAGQLTHDELEAHSQGPRTIRERARIVGALVTVESRPGFGSRVEIAVPLAGS